MLDSNHTDIVKHVSCPLAKEKDPITMYKRKVDHKSNVKAVTDDEDG